MIFFVWQIKKVIFYPFNYIITSYTLNKHSIMNNRDKNNNNYDMIKKSLDIKHAFQFGAHKNFYFIVKT